MILVELSYISGELTLSIIPILAILHHRILSPVKAWFPGKET